MIIRLGRVMRSPGLVSVLIAILLGGLLLFITGSNPFTVYRALLEGALEGTGLRNSIKRSVPIIGMALAVGVAIRSGLLNLGVEAQLVLGGLAGTAATLALPAGLSGTLVGMCVGAIAGTTWALLAAFGQTRLQVPLLISTLLLNFIGRGIASYIVRFWLSDSGIEAVATKPIPDSSRLPSIPGADSISWLEGTDWSLIIVLGLAVILAVWQTRTRGGFETRVIGLNQMFGRYGGVAVNPRSTQVMALSGGIAGLVGAMLVLGEQGRYFDGELVRSNFAWTGLMVALLAATRPGVIVIAGFGFAALQIGGLSMQRTVGVEAQFSLVIQALIIVALTVVAGQVRRNVTEKRVKNDL